MSLCNRFKQVSDRSKTYFYHTYFMSTWNHNTVLANQVYLKVFEKNNNIELTSFLGKNSGKSSIEIIISIILLF